MEIREQDSIAKDIGKVLGDSGTQRFSGYFAEEYSQEWLDARRCTNVETMRRSDGTVKQLLLALKTPLLAVTPTVEVDSDDPIDLKARDLCEKSIFGMARTWKEFFREALTSLDFGFSVFELIYVKRDDGIYLSDLAARIQKSILNWQLDDGRRGIVQLIFTDEVGLKQLKFEIPMNKLLVFTNEKEGDDLTGQSVLRPAWKHFYIKDNLYKISAISCERYGVGVPVITTPESGGGGEKDMAEEIGRNLRANEKSFITLPSPGWKVEILTPSGNPQQGQIEQLIQHHDRQILAAGLAAFLNLGAGSTGSFALSQDQSSFFLTHIEDKARYYEEQITKQVFERLTQINFGKRDKYPYLKFPKLGDVDLSAYSTTIKTLNDAGLLKTSPKFTQFIHTTFKLPEITDEELEDMEIEEINSKMDALEAEDQEPEGEDDMPIDENMGDDMPEDDEDEQLDKEDVEEEPEDI